MRRSNHDCIALVAKIEAAAKELDLLPPDGVLTYVPGNTSQGLSPYIGATVHDSRNGRRYLSTGVDFLPVFRNGDKTTPTQAWIILEATHDALAAVIKAKETPHV